MFNLIRMNLYRIFHTRSTYINAGSYHGICRILRIYDERRYKNAGGGNYGGGRTVK